MACDQQTRSSGQGRRQTSSNTDRKYSIPAIEGVPIMPLCALLRSDASPTEIRRRLRLNVAIRILLDAIEESGVCP
jgi:hypothetical protein